MQAELKGEHIGLKDNQVMSEISKSKAREERWEGMLARAKDLGTKGVVLIVIAQVSAIS